MNRSAESYTTSESVLGHFGIVALLFAASLFTVVSRSLAATTPRSVMIAAENLFEIGSGRTKVVCGRISGRWIGGTVSSSGRFVSNAERVRALKRDLAKARGIAARRRVQRSLDAAQKKERKEAPICRPGPSAGPSPTPTPILPGQPTPTPRPTATRVPCFNNAGDTACFEIPGGITGNITRGASYHQSLCVGCHGERRNRSYTQLNSSFSSISAMAIYNGQLSSGEVADLTAFLNRFNPNQ
jgi:hypothetical protein